MDSSDILQWQRRSFPITMHGGGMELVDGIVSADGAFGIHIRGLVCDVTHIPTGWRLHPPGGFVKLTDAMTFCELIRPLTNWKDISVGTTALKADVWETYKALVIP